MHSGYPLFALMRCCSHKAQLDFLISSGPVLFGLSHLVQMDVMKFTKVSLSPPRSNMALFLVTETYKLAKVIFPI
jgi:hypothetical protein